MQQTIDSVRCIPVHCVARFLRYVFWSRKKVITFCNRCDLRYLLLISLQSWFTPDPKVSQTFFFVFLFVRSETDIGERAREREKEFFFPSPTPLRWRSINPPPVYFLSRVLDGLWRQNRGSVNRLSQSAMFSFSRHEFSFETVFWYSSRSW